MTQTAAVYVSGGGLVGDDKEKRKMAAHTNNDTDPSGGASQK